MIDVAFIHAILGQRYFLSSNDALTVFPLLVFAECAAAANSASSSDSPQLTYFVSCRCVALFFSSLVHAEGTATARVRVPTI